MPKLLFIYGSAALVLMLGLATVWNVGNRSHQPNGFSSHQLLEQKWSGAFDRDPIAAYADFLKDAGALSYDQAHKLSHVIGEVLYNSFGDTGISRCTSDFGFGCYHGFAGTALNSRGLSEVKELSIACSSSGDTAVAFGCIHGIGHGILSYLGNDSLAKTLEACEPINAGALFGGCYGGAFMEYNFNTMQSADGIELRPFSTTTAYEPCSTQIPERFKVACFYDQPAWWTASFDHLAQKEGERYREAGALCAEVKDQESRDVCFRGIGNVIGPESGYDSSVMKRWCELMPDPRERDLCYHEALQHLLQSQQGKSQLMTLCGSGAISYPILCGRS